MVKGLGEFDQRLLQLWTVGEQRSLDRRRGAGGKDRQSRVTSRDECVVQIHGAPDDVGQPDRLLVTRQLAGELQFMSTMQTLRAASLVTIMPNDRHKKVVPSPLRAEMRPRRSGRSAPLPRRSRPSM